MGIEVVIKDIQELVEGIPYNLTEKQLDEIREGNILGGRVVNGEFLADWNYYIEIPESASLGGECD